MESSVMVWEMFVSLQGETSRVGVPCFFVRLAGCNLRCGYCDTRYAYEGGTEWSIPEIVAACRASKTPLIAVTGGEPLLQPATLPLLRALREALPERTVLLETNGSFDISAVPEGVVTVLDLKCPGSGSAHAMDFSNLDRLRPYDEVKCILTSRADYEWARDQVLARRLTERCTVLFGAVWESLAPADLAQWILEDGLDVRLQVQMHKILGIK